MWSPAVTFRITGGAHAGTHQVYRIFRVCVQHAPGSVAEGQGRGPLGPVQEGFGDRPRKVARGFGHRRLRDHRRQGQGEAGRLRGTRVFLCMLQRLLGFVIVDAAIFLVVMVLDTFVVLDFVCKRCATGSGRQSTLHGKAVQGQGQQEEEEADDAVHGNHPVSCARL